MSPSSVLAIVLMTLAGWQVSALQLQSVAGRGFDLPSLTVCVALLAFWLPFSILIHEGGHWLAGTLLGQCCRRFAVGPVEFARDGRGWTLRRIPLRSAGGLVDLVPSRFARIRLQIAGCAAGGPCASLLAALLAVWFGRRSQTAGAFWFWSFSVQWAVIGVGQLLPVRTRNARSDGYRIWEVVRGGAAVDRLQRDLLIPASHATILRVRDWPRELVVRLAETPAEPWTERYCLYLAYIHFLDAGDALTAGTYLHRLLAATAPNDPPEYPLEAAYFIAAHGGDSVNARQWLAAATCDAAEPWVRQRAEAALAWASGDARQALQIAEQALTAVRAAPPCGAYEYEAVLLEALLQKIAVPAPVPA